MAKSGLSQEEITDKFKVIAIYVLYSLGSATFFITPLIGYLLARTYKRDKRISSEYGASHIQSQIALFNVTILGALLSVAIFFITVTIIHYTEVLPRSYGSASFKVALGGLAIAFLWFSAKTLIGIVQIARWR